MKLIQETPEKIVMRLEANETLANSIRRSLEEIPVLAIDEVEFFKNDSALYDEYIAHRVGLLPLKTDKKMGKKTEISFNLKKTGPGMVYSGDFKGSGEMVYGNIPITLLEKGQELEISGVAKLGVGLEHAKYLPGLCYYRHVSEIKSKNAKVQEIVERCKGFVNEKKGSTLIADLNDLEKEEIEKIEAGSVSDSNEIVLIIETFGQMKPKDVLIGAINVLNANLDEVEKAIK